MGSSFLRTYLQKVSGIATGDENHIRLQIELQLGEFKGSGISDDSTWVNKTHWPSPAPYGELVYGNKAIVCVRNPYDNIVSLFQYYTHFIHAG